VPGDSSSHENEDLMPLKGLEIDGEPPRGKESAMDKYVNIGPNALFAAAVLGPEWGREYRQVESSARGSRAADMTSRERYVAQEATGDAGEPSREQMVLL